MAGKGEEVASSIDAQVRDAVEKLVGEIRSSVEDIREAVDQQLKAALQSVQADVNSMSFLPQIQKAIAELEGTAAGAQPAAPSGGTGAAALKSAMQSVERGKSQVDVLNGLLEQALQFGSRAALLILRGETFSGWKGTGFSQHGGNDETIKRFNAAPGLVSQLDEVLRQERVVEWDGANLAGKFGISAPARALLIPMVIKDKVAAAIYIDAVPGDEKKLDRNALELLVFMTGLLVDTLAIRKKIPSPTLSPGDSAGAASSSAPARPAAAAPAPPRAAAPAPPRPAPAPAPTPQKSDATVAFNAAQMREMVAAATPAPPQKSAPEPALGGGGEDRPSTQFVPQAESSAAPWAAPEMKRRRSTTKRGDSRVYSFRRSSCTTSPKSIRDAGTGICTSA